jgi:hypothetical protein
LKQQKGISGQFLPRLKAGVSLPFCYEPDSGHFISNPEFQWLETDLPSLKRLDSLLRKIDTTKKP